MRWLICHSLFVFFMLLFSPLKKDASFKNLPLPHQETLCFQTMQLMKWFLTSNSFSDKEKHLRNTEFNDRWLDGLTAVFMGSSRWKLNWHFYAHSLGQMLGRTRCCSCFFPASPTTEWNIKHRQWSHWKLLPLPPEGLGGVHNYWSTKSSSAD